MTESETETADSTSKEGYARKLRETLPRIREQIADACERVGRSPDEVRLVAVTKGHPIEVVDAALDAGLRELGENRVGALEARASAYTGRGIRWHMIGHLQRRKAGGVIEHAALLHSLDSVRLAERLQRLSEREGETVRVLVQCNTSGEESKYGFEPDEAIDAIAEMTEFPAVRIEGLMTMAPFTDDEAVLRRTFRSLRELGERAVREVDGYDGSELSMGMTNDLAVAIEEGSTMVRVGTALFGERPG